MLCGLPFFLLGDVIRKTPVKYTSGKLWAVAAVSALVTLAENVFLLNTTASFNADCFISTPLLACSLFMLGLKHNGISNRPALSKIAKLGKIASTVIYISHPIVVSFLEQALSRVSGYAPIIYTVWSYSAPIIVLVLCTVFAVLIHRLQKKFQSYKASNHKAPLGLQDHPK